MAMLGGYKLWGGGGGGVLFAINIRGALLAIIN